MSCLLSLCWSLVMLSLGPRFRLEHSVSSPGALRTVLSCRHPLHICKAELRWGWHPASAKAPHTEPRSWKGTKGDATGGYSCKALFPDEVTFWSWGEDAT